MKTSKFQIELIAYASSFVSFILPKLENVKEIILFGSVARGEADERSDIDLFFDVEKKKEEKLKKIIEIELKKFYKSKFAEIWFLKGIKNPIKISAGKLEEWKLKRSIISDGISFYGKYKEIPGKLKGFMFFNIEPIKNITKRNRIVRKLFGREEKNYMAKGIIEEINGKKLTASSFIAPLENANKIIKILQEEKVDFKFFEIWTDQASL